MDQSSPVESNIAPGDTRAAQAPDNYELVYSGGLSRNVIMCVLLYGPRMACW